MTATASLPLVHLVVLTYNGADYIADLIRSVRAQDYPRTQLTVVDNASSDSTVGIAEGLLGDRDHLVRNTTNTGCARGYNIGASSAVGAEIICFLNQDVVLHPKYCSAMVERFCQDPEVSALQPLVRFLDSPELVENCGHTVDQWLATRTIGHRVPMGQLVVPPKLMLTLTAPAIRGSVFRAQGGFDEALFIYFEDTDLSLRIWKSGGCIGFEPQATVEHVQAASAAKESDSWHAFLYARNRLRLLWKHADSVDGAARLAGAAIGGLALAAVLAITDRPISLGVLRGIGWNIRHWRDNERARRAMRRLPLQMHDLLAQGAMIPSGGPTLSARKALAGRSSWESTGVKSLGS